MNKLSVIIPCYYNESTIRDTFNTLYQTIQAWKEKIDIEFVFVDDGSKDNTYHELLKIHEDAPGFTKIVKLVSNVGSYNALYAGLEYATGDCNVVISADLQDPPELIDRMYNYWIQGVKLVMANRFNRHDKIAHKWSASFFHFLMQKFAIKNAPAGGFDFVLFDKEIRIKILELKERNSNIFYMMIWLGYDFVNIPYTRHKNKEGKSRWTLGKKIKLFIDSFVSFSYKPIRIISIIGLILGLGAFIYGLFIIIARIFGFIAVEGWSALMVVLLFVSSFQMVAMGILGEYLWRVLDNTRKRPLYTIDKLILPE
jgi:glycosyltransferase involved in cell wall biosynthesis